MHWAYGTLNVSGAAKDDLGLYETIGDPTFAFGCSLILATLASAESRMCLEGLQDGLSSFSRIRSHPNFGVAAVTYKELYASVSYNSSEMDLLIDTNFQNLVECVFSEDYVTSPPQSNLRRVRRSSADKITSPFFVT